MVHSNVDCTSAVAYIFAGQPLKLASILRTRITESSSVGAKLHLGGSASLRRSSIMVGGLTLNGIDTTSDSGFAYFLRSQFFGAVKRNFAYSLMVVNTFCISDVSKNRAC